MSRLGMPDLGVATLNDMRDSAAMIASLDPSVPLIADADTGYGGPLMVGRTVTQYIRAGVAALHLEDQVQTKRCGHLLGKQLVSEEEFISRIKAAVMAREGETGDIVIIARTDALQSLGYDDARERLRKAIEAGADVAFLEGITTREEGKQICQDLAPIPVLFNCVPGGVSPELSVQEAKDLGYRIIIFPGIALSPVYEAVSEAALALKETGRAPPGKKGLPPKQVFEICGLKECMEFDMAAGGKLYSSGV
ncbi:Fc.00g072610.m01.CDS01 [Cosmosporella sp. VM-42]